MTPSTPFDRRMLEALVCPVTQAMLTYDAEAQELIDFVQSRKGAVNTPKQLWLEAELPVTSLGKIDKKALRARFWDGQARQVG